MTKYVIFCELWGKISVPDIKNLGLNKITKYQTIPTPFIDAWQKILVERVLALYYCWYGTCIDGVGDYCGYGVLELTLGGYYAIGLSLWVGRVLGLFYVYDVGRAGMFFLHSTMLTFRVMTWS